MTSRYTHGMRDSDQKVRAALSRAFNLKSNRNSNVIPIHPTASTA